MSNDECRDTEAALQIKEMRDLYFQHDGDYIFQVDLDYPPQFHDRDEDYPLATETMTIDARMADNEKQVELRAKYYGSACPFRRKLVCSFLPKRHYVVYGHLAILSRLRPQFQPYIAHYNEMQQKFKADLSKKDFYKLLNNSINGKPIESPSRRSDIILLNDMNKARQLAEKPHCIDFFLYSNNH